MNKQGKTRLANRIKRFSNNIKKVDEDKRRSIIADKLNYLQSDYYEEPNRLAENNDSEDFEVDADGKQPTRKQKIQRRILKKIKKESDLRKNFNLMKVIKDQALYDKPGPNFVTIRVKPSKYPARKYCSICGNLSKSSCTRCGERVCRLKCWRTHSEVKCLNFELQY